PALATELANLPVDIIVASGMAPSHAATAVTSTIPIVMGASGDPVGTGLVASLARPGGNVTGMSLQTSDLAAKRLQLLKEILPTASRVAVIRNPNNPVNVPILHELEVAARMLGLQMQVL